jgi:signal peptidase II
MARFWKLLVLMCFLIIIDQLVKGWTQTQFQMEGQSITVIDGFFNLTYVKNTGAAFGMGGKAEPVLRAIMFLAVPTFFSFWVLFMLFKSIKGTFHMSLAYALILAGAIGNLIDRFYLGYVVDMFHFYFRGYHFYVFNIADSCISIAAGILIGDMIWQARLKNKSSQKHQS